MSWIHKSTQQILQKQHFPPVTPTHSLFSEPKGSTAYQFFCLTPGKQYIVLFLRDSLELGLDTFQPRSALSTIALCLTAIRIYLFTADKILACRAVRASNKELCPPSLTSCTAWPHPAEGRTPTPAAPRRWHQVGFTPSAAVRERQLEKVIEHTETTRENYWMYSLMISKDTGAKSGSGSGRAAGDWKMGGC